MKLSDIKNKKIAIWGYGVEGKATAQYLSNKGIDFTILCKEEERDEKYKCVTTSVDKELLAGFEVIVKSPGISPYSPLLKDIDVQMTSATAIWFANERHQAIDTKVIVVTGTKGKSTTASLLTHVLQQSGKSVNLVGNIGQALISSTLDYDYIVLEASSFQVYDGNISADIAVITNLFEEHLDWHAGADNYFRDKLNILKAAKIKIINANNTTLTKLVDEQDVLYFNAANAFHVKGEELMYDKEIVLNLSQVKLIGVHNLENIGAVLSVCQQLKLDMAICVEAIKSFKPLAHRLQSLGKIGQHYAINDSIATTPVATLAAMKTVDLSNTTLLVGGYDRGNNWQDFADEINENPPGLLLISGQNGEIIHQRLQVINAKFRYLLCADLVDAISLAQLLSPAEGVILLSPGAPSFDQFDSYIKRGEFFATELRKHET